MVKEKNKESKIFKSKFWENFFQDWKQFFHSIIDPFALILIALAIVFGQKDNFSKYHNITQILVLLISIFSGIAGSRIISKWNKYNESSTLKARGITSIRSLYHLLGNINSLSNRIEIFIERSKSHSEDGNYENVFITNCEEIKNLTDILKNGTEHSIENWKDIIPDADNVIQLSNLIEEKTKSKSELDELKKVLQKGLEQSQEEKERALKLLVEKEEKINNLEKSINTLKSNIDPSITSYGFSKPFVTIRDLMQYNYQCNDCKNKFFLNIMDAISISHETPAHECPKCKSNNISPII